LVAEFGLHGTAHRPDGGGVGYGEAGFMAGDTDRSESAVNRLTVAGWAMALMPLLTMAHEIGGHAATCAALGGDIAEIGAFYVRCTGLEGASRVAVSLAGVVVNVVVALAAYRFWRHASSDSARLLWWLAWVTQGFVAAGYFAFSGVTGAGDLGVVHGSLAGVSPSLLWRVLQVAGGIAAYGLLVRAAIRGLDTMLGDAPVTIVSRRNIALTYYGVAGIAAVAVGLANPVGLWVTLMSAAASTFGGLAGLISVGLARPRGTILNHFVIRRDWRVVALGAAMLAGFALVLGPTLTF
jgi:hypothetical protein